jgi:hypothetical protein
VENVFEKADVEVCYVTRSYLTRHGDGSMEHEITPGELKKQLPGVCADLTNVENCFQGRLRYGKMDADLLTARVLSDFAHCSGAVRNRFRPSLMVTHLNEYACIDTDLAFGFLEDPKAFSLSELRLIHEAILGHKLDIGNFRRTIKRDYEASGRITEKGLEKGAVGRPAMLYCFSQEDGPL